MRTVKTGQYVRIKSVTDDQKIEGVEVGQLWCITLGIEWKGQRNYVKACNVKADLSPDLIFYPNQLVDAKVKLKNKEQI